MSSIFKESVCSNMVALITGGGSGIGFEIAKQLGKHGCKIMLMGRRKLKLEKAVVALRNEKITAAYYSGDVRKENDAIQAIAYTMEQFSRIDILVNSAAGNFLSTAEELSLNGFKTVIDIDAVGCFNMCHAIFPIFKKLGKGKIINLSATIQLGATWYQVHASAAKAAIDSITRSLALEWGTYGIQVIGIAPGPIVDTPVMSKLALLPNPNDKDTSIERIKSSIPLHRLGNRKDIAMMAVFLCTEAGNFISGDTIIIDGAHWLYKPEIMPREMVSFFSRKEEQKSKLSKL